MSRIMLFLASYIYIFSLTNLLANYAAVEWVMYGFSYKEPEFIDLIAATFGLLVWSFLLPKKIDYPSSLILIIVYVFVCLPATVTILCFEKISAYNTYIFLFALILGFSFSCLLVQKFKKKYHTAAREYSNEFILILICLWCLSLVTILYFSIGIMSFAGFDSIYEQREIGAAKNLFEGYIQTYFGYVISPALLVIGLQKKKYMHIIMGCIGALTLYLVTAEKAVISYPIFIAILYYILKSKNVFYSTSVFIMLIFSIFLLFASVFYEDLQTAEFVAWYLGIRTLLIPGAFIVHYADYFSQTGYTYMTHITGISSFIDVPSQYAGSTRWPSIGHLVGENYLNIPTMNANANFIASDGIASGGIVGLVISLIIFGIFLVLLDKTSKEVKINISLPVLLPIALTLTNGSLFTVLISFGGLFWILVFKFYTTTIFHKNKL